MKKLLFVFFLTFAAIPVMCQTTENTDTSIDKEAVKDTYDKAEKKRKLLRVIQISVAVFGGIYYATKK